MKLSFTKMHGCGNNYIYINCFEQKVTDPEKLSVALSEAIADGWFSEGELVKADGSEAGTDTVQNEKSGMAVRSEGGATLMVGGKVLYRSSNNELKDDSTVSLPETGTAYVIFKR